MRLRGRFDIPNGPLTFLSVRITRHPPDAECYFMIEQNGYSNNIHSKTRDSRDYFIFALRLRQRPIP